MIDSDILDVSEALTDLERLKRVKTVTQTNVDMKLQRSVIGRDQRLVVQVADKSKLNPEQVDWARSYIQVHSKSMLAKGELIEHEGKDHKIISDANQTGYGYIEVIAESTNKPLEQENA